MKIGIELNNIVRDLNKQIIKYYKKDINQSFDDKNVNYNVTNVIDSIDFKSKKAKFEYMYVDYPYEIFGCAPTTHRNLAVTINNWLISLGNKEDDRYDVKFFSFADCDSTICITLTNCNTFSPYLHCITKILFCQY
jgi:hypothetical protein